MKNLKPLFLLGCTEKAKLLEFKIPQYETQNLYLTMAFLALRSIFKTKVDTRVKKRDVSWMSY
jgi:hypothetical protein